MLNIVLFGPPGSGKGTQAQNIIQQYNLVHLSTGDMLRAEIAAQTTLGLEAKMLMDKGELVPDSVVIGMIEAKLAANTGAKGFVFVEGVSDVVFLKHIFLKLHESSQLDYVNSFGSWRSKPRFICLVGSQSCCISIP